MLSLIVVMFSGCKSSNETKVEDVLDQLNVEYSYALSQTLISYTSNDVSGYRTAGSEAEKEAAIMLEAAFKEAGLQDVKIDEFQSDAWEFKKAELLYEQDGEQQVMYLGGFATQLVMDETIDVVYAGQGTERDYEALDVKDKLVLIDINQREDWWVNYPAYEAYLHGAKAVLVMNEAGYAEGDEHLINAQDICGPAYAPALSISKHDAAILKALIEQNGGRYELHAVVDSTLTSQATSQNVVGFIPGKDPDSYIILGSHYDAYFHAFSDNVTAVAMNLGIAKAIIDSGYVPEKTIMIVAHGAEEWGVSNSKYDWAAGSYNEIFNLRPELADKTFAMLNLDGVGYDNAAFEALRSDYEYVSMLNELVEDIPLGESVFQEAVEVRSPLNAMTDDFSYSLAGIPSFKDDPRTKEFSKNYYHTQYDNTENLYNAEAYAFQHQFYTRLLLTVDGISVMPLDFSNRFEAMREHVNEEVFEQLGIDLQKWNKALDETIVSAKELYDELATSSLSGEQATKKNRLLQQVFKFSQDRFVRFTWEDENIFPYEQVQQNIEYLTGAIEALEQQDVTLALDEYLYGVDNNWYAYDFSKETYTFFTDQVLTQSQEVNQWGHELVYGHVDLYDIIHILQAKTTGDHVDDELESLKQIRSSQEQILKSIVEQQIKDIEQVHQDLKTIQAN